MFCRYQSRRARGHGWSKKGSKKERRLARAKTRKPRFYAVALGWRPGIYKTWSSAHAQIKNYNNNCHKSFDTLEKARIFMQDHAQFPPGVRTPFYGAPNTPLPPDDLIYPPTSSEDSEDSDDHQDAPAPAPSVTPTPTTTAEWVHSVQVTPTYVRPDDFREVADMSRRIANDDIYANDSLDPPECQHPACPYCRGDLMQQRYMFMQRLYQLNSALSPHPLAKK